MYTIIGGDGKQYGPISEPDLRKWIAEGRLNAQSLAKAESDAEFRPLAAFPELADMFGLPAPISGIAPVLEAAPESFQVALNKVKVPAIGLIVSAVLNFLFAVWGLIKLPSSAQTYQQVEGQLQQMNNPQVEQLTRQMLQLFTGPFGYVCAIFQIIIAVLIFIGALKMLKLRSYEFAFAAAIMSVIPCINPCCSWPLGLIFGIWSLAILGKVKQNFS